MPITTKDVSSNPVHGEVYSIQHYYDYALRTEQNRHKSGGMGLWCLTPFSTIIQLYHGRSVLLLEETGYPDKTTDLSQVTDKLDHIVLYR
jgi:hypothetical protein